MKEKDFIELGFLKISDEGVVCTDTVTGKVWIEDDFYYYTYDFAIGLSLISCSNDEVNEKGKWWAEVFNTEPNIKFVNTKDVKAFIKLINKL